MADSNESEANESGANESGANESIFSEEEKDYAYRIWSASPEDPRWKASHVATLEYIMSHAVEVARLYNIYKGRQAMGQVRSIKDMADEIDPVMSQHISAVMSYMSIYQWNSLQTTYHKLLDERMDLGLGK